MKYPSLNGKSPFTSNPDGRAKYWSKIGGNGRGRARTRASHIPPAPPTQVAPRTSVPVGTVWRGQLQCPACRSQVTELVRQSAASSRPWVCRVWCSPTDPRVEHFVDTPTTNSK